jgi:nucleoside-diphosphate-sugar epimerase
MADGGGAPKVKPRWLLLGGCGFIGRNLVKYLLDNELASFVRVVDKKAPFMAFLSADYRAALVEQPALVECVQADVADADMLEAAFFAPPREGFGAGVAGAGAGEGGAGEGGAGMSWDFVVNLAAETALGKRDDFYQKAVDGAARSGALAASLAPRLKKYVFVSSASVYEPTAAASREDAPLAPWTAVAESMLRCERALAEVPGLPLVVLRPALVYGPGDFGSLMPRCVVAASYARAGERMELLWDGAAKLRCVPRARTCA